MPHINSGNDFLSRRRRRRYLFSLRVGLKLYTRLETSQRVAWTSFFRLLLLVNSLGFVRKQEVLMQNLGFSQFADFFPSSQFCQMRKLLA